MSEGRPSEPGQFQRLPKAIWSCLSSALRSFSLEKFYSGRKLPHSWDLNPTQISTEIKAQKKSLPQKSTPIG